MSLVDLQELEKGMREQKKQPRAAVRMRCSFLFVGTAEGALCRIFLVVDFALTYTNTLSPRCLIVQAKTSTVYTRCTHCKQTHINVLSYEGAGIKHNIIITRQR